MFTRSRQWWPGGYPWPLKTHLGQNYLQRASKSSENRWKVEYKQTYSYGKRQLHGLGVVDVVTLSEDGMRERVGKIVSLSIEVSRNRRELVVW